MVDLVCSNCGSANIVQSSIQRGIGGGLIGFCPDCAPKRGALPAEGDPSPKMQARRKRMLRDTGTKAYRTKLTPLIPAGTYQPRVKPVEAEPLTMWDDSLT